MVKVEAKDQVGGLLGRGITAQGAFHAEQTWEACLVNSPLSHDEVL